MKSSGKRRRSVMDVPVGTFSIGADLDMQYQTMKGPKAPLGLPPANVAKPIPDFKPKAPTYRDGTGVLSMKDLKAKPA
jgi:hypothetical protein